MLVKNRKTGVIFKASPHLVVRALRDPNFDLIEDNDPLDIDAVRSVLTAEDQGNKEIQSILKDLEPRVKEKIVARREEVKAAKPKAVKPEKPAEQPKDEGPKDDFIELEAMVNALIGGEKDKDHKDRLETAALENFGVNLDKRKSLATLKQEVLALIAEHRGV